MRLVYPGVTYVPFTVFVQISYDMRGWGDMPALHVEFCEFLEDTIDDQHKRLLQAFRYSGKSELITLYVAWRLYLNPEWNCIIVSAAERLAVRNSSQIRRIIESHPLTAHLVPDADEWRSYQFNVRRPNASLHHSVACTSLTARHTGLHADELIGDDCEVSENVRTADGRQLLKDVTQEFMSLADHHLYVGTPHHEDSLLTFLQFDMGFHTRKWPVWASEGVAAWPELRGDTWIAEKQSTISTGRFRSQYLLIPEKSTESVLDVARVQLFGAEMTVDEYDTDFDTEMGRPVANFYILDDKIISSCAYWDLATGLEGRDDSVIAFVALGSSNSYYCLDLEKLPSVDDEGFRPQCVAVLDFCQRNFCNKVMVEEITSFRWGSKTITNTLAEYAKERGKRIVCKDTKRRQKKDEFIAQALEPLLKMKRLYVKRRVWLDSPLKEQMIDFPANVRRAGGKYSKDDAIDALAGAIGELQPRRVGLGDLPSMARNTPRRMIEATSINGNSRSRSSWR